MFNVGAGEMIVIALILLMAVGPEQLPGLIRRVGRTVSEVKGMTEGLRAEFMSGMEEIERATDPEAWAAGNGLSSNVKPRTGPAPGSVNDKSEDEDSGSETDTSADSADSTDADEGQSDTSDPEAGEAALDDSVLDQDDQSENAPAAVDDWASKISNGWDTPDASEEHAFPAAADAGSSDGPEDDAATADAEVDRVDAGGEASEEQ